jgi:endo-1,4-beta-xylanase
MGRRELLTGMAAGGATVGIAACSRPAFAYSPATEPLQLNKIASSRGIVFGSPFTPYLWNLPGNASAAWLSAPIVQLYKRQCGIITDIYQWNNTEPAPGKFDAGTLQYKDAIASLWATQGVKLRGHALVWYRALPTWFASLQGRKAAIDAMTDHIHTLVSQRKGKFHSWDAVNEALNPPDGLPGGLRKGPLTDIIGLDWMDFAFKAAREADPGALLVYNDYGMETTKVADSDAKRTGLLTLIEHFQKEKIPIDAIGFQSHMFANRWQNFDPDSFVTFLNTVASRGLKILITEFDVIELGTPSDPDQRDKAVADFYGTFWQAALSQKAVVVAETWGLADPESWQTQSGKDRQFYRTDGTLPRPLPFDASLMPKPAAQALAAALAGAPSR